MDFSSLYRVCFETEASPRLARRTAIRCSDAALEQRLRGSILWAPSRAPSGPPTSPSKPRELGFSLLSGGQWGRRESEARPPIFQGKHRGSGRPTSSRSLGRRPGPPGRRPCHSLRLGHPEGHLRAAPRPGHEGSQPLPTRGQASSPCRPVSPRTRWARPEREAAAARQRRGEGAPGRPPRGPYHLMML